MACIKKRDGRTHGITDEPNNMPHQLFQSWEHKTTSGCPLMFVILNCSELPPIHSKSSESHPRRRRSALLQTRGQKTLYRRLPHIKGISEEKSKFHYLTDTVSLIQVRFINFIPMQFFHKSLHTP